MPGQPHAIVADDNFLVRMDAADILKAAGFETYEAANADEALRAIEQRNGQIELLFSDVQMPGGSMDGFALARQVARRWPDISIIIASGEVKPGERCMPEGARFIPKPFSAELVRMVLQETLPDEKKPEPLRGR